VQQKCVALDSDGRTASAYARAARRNARGLGHRDARNHARVRYECWIRTPRSTGILRFKLIPTRRSGWQVAANQEAGFFAC
jgi:hypothetical protein